MSEDTMTTEQAPPRYFVNRETGTLCRVIKTDDSYAHIEVLSPTQSRYAMPRAEYDRAFMDTWRPAEQQELRGEGEAFDLPSNFAEKVGPSVLAPPVTAVEDDEETP